MGWLEDRIKDPLGDLKDPADSFAKLVTATPLAESEDVAPWFWGPLNLGKSGDSPFRSEGNVGLAADHQETDPQKELDELARAYRAYTTSSMYEGETPTWIQTEFGPMPVGGYKGGVPEREEDRESSLYRDYTAARTNILDRITAQDKYGGFSPDYGPRSFMPDSDMSEQDIASMLGGYIRGTADYGTPTAQPQTPVAQPQTPGPRQPAQPYFDYSQGNPFAQKAKAMGFTDFQNYQAPNQSRAMAGALRQTDTTPIVGPIPPAGTSTEVDFTPRTGRVAPRLDNPGTLTQAMQAAALRGAEGGQNG